MTVWSFHLIIMPRSFLKYHHDASGLIQHHSGRWWTPAKFSKPLRSGILAAADAADGGWLAGGAWLLSFPGYLIWRSPILE
jgi:hypothetical protein